MLNYISGDATKPHGPGKKIIVHVCNNLGAWGLGFVLALSKVWKSPEISYKTMSKEDRILGKIQIVQVTNDITVINMIAQEGIKAINLGTLQYGILPEAPNYIPPIRYEALSICLKQVNEYAVANNATVHMPRIGAGLAGGKWDIIEDIIKNSITVDTFVYDMPVIINKT